MPSNIERWRTYFAGAQTTSIYVEASFYFLIAAALERRVWIGHYDHKPVFPNQFMWLIAPPGVGKGFPMGVVKSLLRGISVLPPKVESATGTNEELLKNESAQQSTPKIFKLGADSTTFESLTNGVAAATDVVTLRLPNGAVKHMKHQSLAFILDEIESLFHKDNKSLITFLLTMWQCEPSGYDRETKHHGADRITHPCLNILGGMTVNNFGDCMRKGIITSGLTSRILLVYSATNDNRKLLFPRPDKEKLDAYEAIKEHIIRLKTLFGEITWAPGALETAEEYFNNVDLCNANKSPFMQEYYARKNQHLLKMCMAVCFSEQTGSYIITVEHVLRAIALLQLFEKDMHLCYKAGGRNELAAIGHKVVDHIAKAGVKGIDAAEILMDFHSELSNVELLQLLDELRKTKRIENHGTKWRKVI